MKWSRIDLINRFLDVFMRGVCLVFVSNTVEVSSLLWKTHRRERSCCVTLSIL